MPHRRRSLLRGLRDLVPAALFVILACSADSPGGAGDTAAPPPPPERADPAASLDREFQQARAALNAEATALAGLDRASPEYTTRYEAWLRDAVAAERLRSRRDSVRRLTPDSPSGT